mmetsp:Transcript_46986/g.144737  ORF Transcript_46986/g.144737 Transcript_46986/m.144737 type:complete len:227 (-) Transcript_46986:95-775(-)
MPLAVEMPAPVSSTMERHAPDRMKAATPARSKDGSAAGQTPGSPKTSLRCPEPSPKEHSLAQSPKSGASSPASPPPAVRQGTCSWMTTVKWGSSRSARTARTCAATCGESRSQGGTSVSRRTAASTRSWRTEHRRSRKRSWTAMVQPQGGGEASSASSGMLTVASLVLTSCRSRASGQSTRRTRRRGCGRAARPPGLAAEAEAEDEAEAGAPPRDPGKGCQGPDSL